MKRLGLIAVTIVFVAFFFFLGHAAPAQRNTDDRAPRQLPPQYPRVEYNADLRPFVFTGGLTNKTRTATNPYGEHPGWAIGDPGVIYDHLNLGLQRTILRQPVGPGRIGWVLFSAWHPLTNPQRLDFTTGVRDWLGEDHNRKVGVFFGRDCTNPFIRRDIGIPEGPLVPPDPTDEKALLWWMQNTNPLRAIGVSEFWLDRGSANEIPTTRLAIIKLARRMRLLQGIKVGIEAIPQTMGDDGSPDRSLGPDWNYLTKVPGMGRWRQLWHTWIKHGHRDTLIVPAELRGQIEVHCFFHANDTPPPTTGDLEWLSNNGWIVSWLSTANQELIDGPPSEP